MSDYGFELGDRDGAARTATLHTPHGAVATPAFMPVATFGAVRGVSPEELRQTVRELMGKSVPDADFSGE